MPEKPDSRINIEHTAISAMKPVITTYDLPLLPFSDAPVPLNCKLSPQRAGSGYVQPDSSAKTPLAAIEELVLIGYGPWGPKMSQSFSENPALQERAAKANITVVRPDSHSPAQVTPWHGRVGRSQQTSAEHEIE